MASNLSIECADRSVRWYLTPGQASRYEIIVINKSGDEHIECTLTLDEPSEGGTFEPASFTLRPRERKTVALTFAENTQVPRDQITMISVRDSNGDVLASLERGLISAGGTDCTVVLAFKEPILDGDQVRGFVVACTIKSLSATAGQFALQYTPHPSLEFVDVMPVKLEPGQTQTVAVPILWNRSVRDSLNNNHPHVVEIGVAVSQGKRAGRLAWDTVENRLAAYAPKPQPPPEPVQQYSAPAAAQQPYAAPAQESTPPPPEGPDLQVSMFGEPAAPPAPAPVAQASPATPPPIVQPSTPTATAPPSIPPPPWVTPQVAASAAPPPAQQYPPPAQQYAPPAQQYAQPPADAYPPPSDNPENDDELMSLLVGKPVSPPAGWRGPGRDAPDAPPTEPPTIFARTPASVTRPPQPPAPPPQAPPPQPPPPPTPRQVPAASAAPPPGTPWRPPTTMSSGDESAPQPYRRTYTPSGATTQEEFPSESTDEGLFGESPLEASVVGRPPTRAEAAETGREQKAISRRTMEPEPPQETRGGQLTTIAIGGTAILAVGLAVFFYMRWTSTPQQPGPQAIATATAVATVPPAIVLQTPPPATNVPHKNQSPNPAASGQANAPSAAPSVAATVAAQATQRVVQTAAPTPRPAPVHVALVPRPAKPKPHPTRRPVPANPNLIVSMQGVDAHYGPGGHAVRILWGAAGQASATVQLIDDKGGVLSTTDVPGTRQSAVLYVPHSYRGPVTAQVVSVGASGERVTQSTSLPPFGR